jgi:mRNA interferase MazF
VIAQGDIWWAALPEPVGSGPGFDHPVVIVQGDTFNRSLLATVVVIPLTTNTRLAAMPGNVLVASRNTGLPKDSVANVTQIIAIDRSLLTERIGRISC